MQYRHSGFCTTPNSLLGKDYEPRNNLSQYLLVGPRAFHILHPRNVEALLSTNFKGEWLQVSSTSGQPWHGLCFTPPPPVPSSACIVANSITTCSRKFESCSPMTPGCTKNGCLGSCVQRSTRPPHRFTTITVCDIVVKEVKNK